MWEGVFMRILALLIPALAALWSDCAHAQTTQTYTYDPNGRLIGVATATGDRSGGVVTEYDYDDADNRTERQSYGVGPPTNSYQLTNGQTLLPTQFLLSPSNSATLILQQDGNLALYCGSTPKWATGTTSGRSLYLQMQSDGNLVIYDVDFLPLWASNTAGNPGAVLTLHNSGNLILMNAANTSVLWYTNTTCP